MWLLQGTKVNETLCGVTFTSAITLSYSLVVLRHPRKTFVQLVFHVNLQEQRTSGYMGIYHFLYSLSKDNATLLRSVEHTVNSPACAQSD